jgi:hypothetical protein
VVFEFDSVDGGGGEKERKGGREGEREREREREEKGRRRHGPFRASEEERNDTLPRVFLIVPSVLCLYLVNYKCIKNINRRRRKEYTIAIPRVSRDFAEIAAALGCNA